MTDAGVSGEDAQDDDAPEATPDTEVAAPVPVLRRAEVLKARRRLLSTLITLTVIAIGLVVTRIDAYWIVIPPTALLTGYLVLLRKFAHIDAERARRAARIRRATADAQAGQVARGIGPGHDARYRRIGHRFGHARGAGWRRDHRHLRPDR